MNCLIIDDAISDQDNRSESTNIDELGFNAVTNSTLFGKPGLEIRSTQSLSVDGQGKSRGSTTWVSSLIELEQVSGTANQGLIYAGEEPSQGLKVKRLSADWKTDSGTVTVGNDWANFQDFLGTGSGSALSSVPGQGLSRQLGMAPLRTTDLVKWTNPDGFSISLEGMAQPVSSENELNIQTSPGLVLTWESRGESQAQYRVSALGRSVEIDDTDEIGWGLNLEGGWRFGDLFAALSVTIGEGIDSLIFRGRRDDASLNASGDLDWGESIAIKPSIQYSLNERTDLRLSLGRFISRDGEFGSKDTLDTIHLGYSWSPWPSTRFGVEVIGTTPDGLDSDATSSASVKFGASRQF